MSASIRYRKLNTRPEVTGVRYPLHWILMLAAIGCFSFPGTRAAVLSPQENRGDTLFMIERPSYTMMARRRTDLLPTTVLDQAAGEYERIFGVRPPAVLVYTAMRDTVIPKEPPTARDTVWLSTPSTDSADAAPMSGRKEHTRREVLFLARGWIRSAAERTRVDSATDSLRVIPPWFEIGSAMLIAFSDVAWPPLMEQALSVSVLPLEMLFALRDTQQLTEGELMAMAVQSAAVLAYFRENDPQVLVGLPDRLREGTPIETALLRGRSSDMAAFSIAWHAWYRRMAGGV